MRKVCFNQLILLWSSQVVDVAVLMFESLIRRLTPHPTPLYRRFCNPLPRYIPLGVMADSVEYIFKVLLYLLVDLYCAFDDEGFSADEGEGEGVEVGNVFRFGVVGWGTDCDCYCSRWVYESAVFRGGSFPSPTACGWECFKIFI